MTRFTFKCLVVFVLLAAAGFAEPESIAEMRNKAEQGNATAQNDLGVIYYNGEGVPKDDAEAVKWLRQAAEQGHATAQFNLGLMYANGYGVQKDSVEAVKCYRLAADQGSATAQYNLGWAYENGDGVPKDAVEAVKWYSMAAKQGYAGADQAISHDLVQKAKREEAERFMVDGNQAYSQGNKVKALECYDAALSRYKDLQYKLGEANAFQGLGYMELLLGNTTEARKCYDDALRGYKDQQSKSGEAEALYGLGEVESLLGNTTEARKYYDAALSKFQDVEKKSGEAKVRHSLGNLESVLGNTVDAREYYKVAGILYGEAGLVPEQRQMENLSQRPDAQLAKAASSSSEDTNEPSPEQKRRGILFWGVLLTGLLASMLVAILGWRRYQGQGEALAPSGGVTATTGRRWLHYDPDTDTSVIFVHGIMSGPDGFRHLGTNTFWPELLYKDKRIGRPNVFIGQFFTAVDSGVFDIPQAAEELKVQISTPAIDGRPAPITAMKLVFIAHSTGGIVVRDLLTRYPELFNGKKVGLVLMASPSRGSAWADRIKMVIALAGNRMAGQLQSANEMVADLDRRFADFVHKTDEVRGFVLRGTDLFENRFVLRKPILRLFVSTRTVVVSERDSGSYFGAGRIVPDTDHFSVIKPDNVEHPSHRYLVEWWVNQFNKT